MADNIPVNPAAGGQLWATTDSGGAQHQKVVNEFLDANGAPVPMSASDPLPTALTTVPQVNLDAFNRWRSSHPLTIFSSKLLGDAEPLYWDEVQTSGAGTSSAYSADLAAVTMSVGNLTAGTRVRQTFARFNYQPGKSTLVTMTGVMGAGAAGNTIQIGLFDDNNGLFFEQAGAVLRVVRRTHASGAPVDNVVAQAAWNLDPLDGTGPSEITLDVTKIQFFLFDFQWQGAGRIRFGFDIGGQIVYCHEVNSANVLSTVYMSTSNLPLRFTISNDGTGPAASLMCVCCAVVSEGGQDATGSLRSFSNGNTHIDANVAGTLYVLIGLRLKTTHLGSDVDINQISLEGTTNNDDFHWQLLLNPTVATGLTYGDVTNAAVQAAVGATAKTVTGGTLIASGYAIGETSVSIPIDDPRHMGSAIDGTRDEIVLAVMPIGGAANLDIYASITWREST